MAAPTWVAAGTKTNKPTNVGNTSTVAPPAGHASGDLLVIAANPYPSVTLATPSGWTLLRDSGYWNTSFRTYLFWKLAASSSEASPTLTTSADSYCDSQMYAFRGVDGTTPIDASVAFSAASSSTSMPVPAITTVTNDALIVYVGAQSGGDYLWNTPPTGATERVETATYIVKFVVATEPKTTAGTEAADVYGRDAGGIAVCGAFAVRPAAAAGAAFVPTITLIG